LGKLPATRKWREVVALLAEGADDLTVASSAADAAEYALQRAASDPGFLEAFWLLTQLPLAARGPAFADDLRRLGLDVPDQPGLMELTAAFTDAVDRAAQGSSAGGDLGEMARLAAVESVCEVVGNDLPALFGVDPQDVRRELGKYASGDRFAVLAREFFSRLTYRTLDYYLSRELAHHIGPDRRFDDAAARGRFEQALAWYCHEASRIVEAFAGGWYGKTHYRGEGLSRAAAGRFAPVAFKKVRAELQKRRDAAA